jgi:hypothetical protein
MALNASAGTAQGSQRRGGGRFRFSDHSSGAPFSRAGTLWWRAMMGVLTRAAFAGSAPAFAPPRAFGEGQTLAGATLPSTSWRGEWRAACLEGNCKVGHMLGSRAHLIPHDHPPHRTYIGARPGGRLALLRDLREQLVNELRMLTYKRKDLEAHQEAGRELKEVAVEMEATRRMLGLVQATEQQLAGQGQEELHENGPAAAASVEAEVRSRPRQEPARLPLMRVPAPADNLRGSAQAAPTTVASAASAAPDAGPPRGRVGGPPAAGADAQGGGAGGVHLQDAEGVGARALPWGRRHRLRSGPRHA